MHDKVTVLMAAYNGGKYIEEQLESLSRQKGVEVRVIVRDDGSTDDTRNILDAWKETGMLSWYTGKHLGVQKGYYDLMKKAGQCDSEYYAFCDQDDRWDDDKLLTAVRELEKFPKDVPALYYSGQRLTDADLNFISDHTLNEKRTNRTRYVITDIAGCTAVFNRSLLLKVLEYEPRYMLMHDCWLYRVCAAVGGNVKVDCSSHMDYRQHGNNMFGIGTGVAGRIRHSLLYITKVPIQAEVMEVKKGYYAQMTPAYRRLTDEICRYEKSVRIKKKLLTKRYINFHNKGLQLTYVLKVLLNKL